jgi:hypothetical protein
VLLRYHNKLIQKNENSFLVNLGRIALILMRSKILRSYGLVLNENPDGSNSIKVRIFKA